MAFMIGLLGMHTGLGLWWVWPFGGAQWSFGVHTFVTAGLFFDTLQNLNMHSIKSSYS